MTTRSTALGSYQFTSSGGHTLWTCPPGNVTLVKSLYLYNSAGAANAGGMTVVNAANTVGLIIASFSLQAASEAAWQGWIVLEAGDRVDVSAAAAGLAFWLSGAVLPAAPLS
jgi:hypothetical protein